MKRNLITRTVGSVLVLRQTNEAPSDAEWHECMKQLNVLLRVQAGSVKVLVCTDGGAPTIPQRELLQKASEKATVRTAVVSDDVKARFTSSTVALRNRNHRSFSVEELPKAYLFLGLTPEEVRGLEGAIKGMGSMLG